MRTGTQSIRKGDLRWKRPKLTAMTVAELKALAKKRKVSLSAGSKKADIMSALLDAAGNSQPVAKKTAAKKTTAKKTAKTKAAAAVKPAPKKAGKTAKKAVLTQKPGASRKVPARKVPEPVLPVHDWKLPPGAEEPLLAQERVSDSKFYTGPRRSRRRWPYAASFRGPMARTASCS